jgi:hypothetical protein
MTENASGDMTGYITEGEAIVLREQVAQLSEDITKLSTRRDNWRERYEQARADLGEHIKGREVLADLVATNPMLRVWKEAAEISATCFEKCGEMLARAEISRKRWSIAACAGFGYVCTDIALAVLA